MQKYEIYLNFMNFYDSLTLERIAYGEMESLIVLEAVVVEIARLARIERHVQTDTPIETQNEEIEVVTQSDTGVQRQIVEETAKRELTIGKYSTGVFVLIILIEVPDVTGIEEESTMKTAKQLATVFEVAYKLDIAILHEVGNGLIAIARETTRTYATNGEGAKAVGSTHIKHLGIGQPVAIAIGIDESGINMTHDTGTAIERPRLGEVGLELHKLGIGILEEFLILIVPFLACSQHGQRDNVTRFGNGGFPTDGMQEVGRTGVGIGIAHLRDEVVLHGDSKIGILLHDGIEGCRMAIHELIFDRKGRELMTTLR